MARFERKYKVEGIEAETIRANLLTHPAGFRELYPNRRVNNIYFDTIDLTTFNQNVAGVNQRKKFRMRWYGYDMKNLISPKFEVKIKHNELGTKEITPCEDIAFKEMEKMTSWANQYSNNFAPLFPVLLNAYERSYLSSADGRFRLTIDRKLQYYSLLGQHEFNGYLHEESGVIIEVKYEEDDDKKAGFILQNLPYRHTKSSKYVNGVTMTAGF